MIWTAMTSHGTRECESHPLVSSTYVRHLTTPSVGQLSSSSLHHKFSSPCRGSQQQWDRSELAVHDNGRMATSRTSTMSAATTAPAARRHRYSRSTTSSVTQMLTESCSSLLQRLTTRVRGPSSVVDHLGATRTRLEDKYSAVLDKYGRRRGEQPEPEEEPEPQPLTKSATTANVVVLSEKAYPYVSATAQTREKTPYRHGEHRVTHHHHHHGHYHQEKQERQQQQQRDPYSSGGHSHRARHKSGQSEARTRRNPTRPVRVGKSEQGERRQLMRLCPVEIDPGILQEDPQMEDEAIKEREVKRKEIQSLILKYSALDEAYNRLGEASSNNTAPVSTMCAIANKYQHKMTSATQTTTVAATGFMETNSKYYYYYLCELLKQPAC